MYIFAFVGIDLLMYELFKIKTAVIYFRLDPADFSSSVQSKSVSKLVFKALQVCAKRWLIHDECLRGQLLCFAVAWIKIIWVQHSLPLHYW